jgi:hypothetical protein
MEYGFWGDEYKEDNESWIGDLCDLVLGHQWNNALAYLQAHPVTDDNWHSYKASTHQALSGGLVSVEFFTKLLDAGTPEHQHAALINSPEPQAGFTTLMTAVYNCASPDIIKLIVNRCPKALTVLDYQGQDVLACAQFVMNSNPRNPNHVSNRDANRKLITQIMDFRTTRLQQLTMHTSIIRQQKRPTSVFPAFRLILNFLMDVRSREPGIIRIICSYIGPKQAPYDDNWFLDEILQEKDKVIEEQRMLIEGLERSVASLTQTVGKLVGLIPEGMSGESSCKRRRE